MSAYEVVIGDDGDVIRSSLITAELIGAETPAGAQAKVDVVAAALAAKAASDNATFVAYDGDEFTVGGEPVDLGSGSGLPSTVVNRTSAYTAASAEFVQADVSAGGFTVTLPAAPDVGALVSVKKVDSSANLVTVVASGGGTIDGDASAVATSQWAGAVFQHVGSNVWRVAASMSTVGAPGPTGAQGAQGPSGSSATSFVLPVGLYFPLAPMTNNTVTLTKDLEYCYPVLLPGSGTLSSLRLGINNNPDGTPVLRMAIRADNGGLPGAVVSETSFTATAGAKDWNPGYAYSGQFWISIVGQGWSATAMTIPACNSPFTPFMPVMLAAARADAGWAAGHTINASTKSGVTGTIAASAGVPSSPTTTTLGGLIPAFYARRGA